MSVHYWILCRVADYVVKVIALVYQSLQFDANKRLYGVWEAAKIISTETNNPSGARQMKTFLNMKTSQGRETADEFERQEGQSMRDYLAYVRQMVKEYQLAGVDVYRSSRCCANWKES